MSVILQCQYCTFQAKLYLISRNGLAGIPVLSSQRTTGSICPTLTGSPARLSVSAPSEGLPWINLGFPVSQQVYPDQCSNWLKRLSNSVEQSLFKKIFFAGYILIILPVWIQNTFTLEHPWITEYGIRKH